MNKHCRFFISLTVLSSILCADLLADTSSKSKRIEVYTISQSFWDVKKRDTLSEIIKQLLPDNPKMREILSKEIIQLNPDAFINNNPDRLKAHIRLWLPNNSQIIHSKIDSEKYEVRSFSWGQAYKLKR